jgi:alkanesulfonate monooxygenase
MSNQLEWGWYAPLDGDGAHVGTYEPEIAPSIDYITQVGQAAETAGFDTLLVPTSLLNSAYTEYSPRTDAITAATAVGLATKRLKILLAFKFGEMHPALLAKVCSSLDQATNGRLLVNVTSGSGSMEARFGETLEHDARYERTWETLRLLKRLWTEKSIDFDGHFFALKNAISEPKPVQQPYPPLYGVGQSEIAKNMSALECDAHLMQCDTPSRVAEQVNDIRARAEKHGRQMRFGIRAQIVVRETEILAWKKLRDMLSRVDARVVAARQAEYAKFDATETKRLVEEALNANLIAPNVWNGMHAVKSGAGTVLVGSPEQIAERIRDYVNAGIDTFIFSCYPHREEAGRVGEMVISRVEASLD